MARELSEAGPGRDHQAGLERERVRPLALAVRPRARAISQGPAVSRRGLPLRPPPGAREGSIEPGQFVIGNGSNGSSNSSGMSSLSRGDEVVMGAPDFVVYRLVTLLFGARAVEVPLSSFRIDLGEWPGRSRSGSLVFVLDARQSTGTATGEAELAFVRALPRVMICVWTRRTRTTTRAPRHPPADPREGRRSSACARSRRSSAWPRCGWATAAPGAEMAGLLDRVRQPFSVNAIGQAAAVAALSATQCEGVRGGPQGHPASWRRFRDLGEAGLVMPSQNKFRPGAGGDGAAVFDALQRRGVIVRPLKIYSLPEWVRVTVGTPAQNERLLAELAAVRR